MRADSMWERWQVLSLVPAQGWYALFGTNVKSESIPLIGWALVEELPSQDPLGIELDSRRRLKRKVVGLVAWGPKRAQVQIAEEIDIFGEYIHQSKIDAWDHPSAV